MELKQKVITWQLIIGALLIVGFGGYFTYFFFNDILPPPPVSTNTRNLFIEKTEKEIDFLKNTEDVRTCKKRYDEITLSLKEDKINDFVSSQEYTRLDKNLNYAFVEQFINQSNLYFEKTEWESNKNKFITDVVEEIKSKRFVEKGSTNWNILSGFKRSVFIYNQMSVCIRRIDAIWWQLPSRIPTYAAFLQVREQKELLVGEKCKKEESLLEKLNDSYNQLNARLPKVLNAYIEQYNSNYRSIMESNYYSYNQKERARSEAREHYNEMVQWKNIYKNLNEIGGRK